MGSFNIIIFINDTKSVITLFLKYRKNEFIHYLYRVRINVTIMRRLTAFLNNLHQGKIRTLFVILFFSVLVTILTNLLFRLDAFAEVMKNDFVFLPVGFFIYGIWIAVIYLLLKKDGFKSGEFGLNKHSVSEGLRAGFWLIILTNLLILLLSFSDPDPLVVSQQFSSSQMILRNLLAFIFNILIGAFIEEVIFRTYLIPQCFHFLKEKINNNALLILILVISTQAFFSLTHLPMLVFRHELTESNVSQIQIELFIIGIIFSIIYLRTQNLIFVTFVHAMINLPLVVIESEFSSQLIILLTVFIMFLFNQQLFRKTLN
ncbi:MAG: CPBP family intramembrane metalloprotease [Cytophagia bacterium]|nr:CPBP family intramembrane metalloprotease [Cytophagia bacterium]